MRTPLTYYGGKQRLADELVALMPRHHSYLEPFAGGAALLFAKARAPRETLNDVDGAVMAFWRAVRDQCDELVTALELTPYARSEWEACRAGLDEPGIGDVERARRLLVLIDQSFARSGHSWSPPSLLADRRGRWQAGTWANVAARVAAATNRLRGVALENCDALELIGRHDVAGSLIYCDPPYTGEHRLSGADRTRRYRHDDHADLWPVLVEWLLGLKEASAMVSGYPCPESEQLEGGGFRAMRLTAVRHAQVRAGNGGSPAPETVWLSPRCRSAQGDLLSEASA